MINIIANIGLNWYSKKPEKRAISLLNAAIDSGVDGVIVPVFTSETLFREQQLIDGARKYEITKDLVRELMNIADSKDIFFYVNPRYPEIVDYCEELRIDGYHISNGDILHTELLQQIAETKRPVLLSTGYSWIEEIRNAIEILSSGTEPVLLHSTGGTPTVAEDAVLSRILNLMSEFFPMAVGLESFYQDDFLDYVAMGYPSFWGVVRRLDLEDKTGIEASYSLAPTQLARLVAVAQRMSEVVEPTFYGDTGFSETDFEARRRLMRLPKDNFLLPPSCCPDSAQAYEG